MVETFTFITILEREGEQIFARRDDKFSFLYGCKLHLAEKKGNEKVRLGMG